MTTPDKLIQGFGRFRERYLEKHQELFRRLREEGQHPKTLVIGCCDSRVDPAIVLDSAPGDLFVIRNVANLVPPFEQAGNYHGTSAALEFAVENLQVEHIVVLGHARCGGIRTLIDSTLQNTADKSFINGWMSLAADACRSAIEELPNASPEEQASLCERRAILGSLHNLSTFDWVKERVDRRQLRLHGWYFDMLQGDLMGYNHDHGQFESLKA